MELPSPLLTGRLVKRYKRFLADVVLDDGREVTAHCPNTGAMTGCKEPGSRVWLSESDNPKRKLKYTWELVDTGAGAIACIHSARANALVEEAIRAGRIAELGSWDDCRREVRYGEENSRIDILLEGGDGLTYVEVKSVTLLEGGSVGLFPDAVSARGSKHLRELIQMRLEGHRAVLFYAVLHAGIDQVRPADAIDAIYGETLREALAAGVEVVAYRANFELPRLSLVDRLPFSAQ